MRENCINEVIKAAGRPITAAEAKGIFERVERSMRQLAKSDPIEWQGLSERDRLILGAEEAALQLEQEAILKKRRLALSIAKQNAVNDYIKSYNGKGGEIEALNRLIAFHGDAKNNVFSIETRANATRNMTLASLADTFDSTKPKGLGLVNDKQGIKDLVYEMYGVDTGNKAAQKGAQAWLKATELLRKRFNDSGGDIGKLEDWALPQHHSQLKVSKAGDKQWISDIIGKLNREKYINSDGSYMTDIQLTDFLNQAYLSIATGGLNKIEAGAYKASGMRANRGNETRQIHFKDPQSYLDYQVKYGDKDIWQVLIGHIDGVSKDIALVETFGPNPDNVFKTFLEDSYQKSSINDPKKMGEFKKQYIKTENLYNFVAGRTQPIASERMAKFFDTLRDLMISSKLGSALITSLSDQGTFAMLAKTNNLPMLNLYSNMMKSLNPANKMELRLARRAGLATETLISSMNRFGTENLGSSTSNKVATTVMRASGLLAWSDAQKRAFGVTMMSSIGQITKDFRKLTDLNKYDHRILLSKGITDSDFKIWKLAEQEDWGGGNNTMLTPESIMRIPNEKIKGAQGDPEAIKFEAARKLLGAVTEEVDMAVVTPGARDRVFAQAGKQRGVLGGELVRSVFLFKSFPISMIARHWARGAGMPTAQGKAFYIAGLMASTTMLGAMAMQANDIVSGRKPKDMDNVKFWISAMLKGGALGLYGDFLFSEETQRGNSPLASMLGPVIGFGEEILGLTQGNILKSALGKETSFGADAVKLIKGITPGANLWYTKAATDHIFFNRMQEFVSPGYLDRMESRSKKVYGQEFWWKPQDLLPR